MRNATEEKRTIIRLNFKQKARLKCFRNFNYESRFCDDFALQSNDREQARTLLTKIEIECDKVGLKLSSSKQRLCSIMSLLRKLFSKT